ncbi:Type VI secretion system effector, Hcp [Pseudomonas sp. NFACC02]|uniref:type VI secretion system tube protein Hcp n=1 Tax=Pseudomonas sp. NFACC02 TaxID=1566250 RepID=UPI0008B0DEE3|nr:type VI secretion system tube protein Hcp [Pseudomonas sp. NFACC02]SER65554.1 Type VI secretion system effector, Hcp [Pseudomonas sp. NFACC02]
MSFDAFIQMDEIGGEALDDKHKGWIEITGCNFGSHQSKTATASSEYTQNGSGGSNVAGGWDRIGNKKYA